MEQKHGLPYFRGWPLCRRERLSGTHRARAAPHGSGKEDGKSPPPAENARAEGPAAALRRTALRAGGEDRHQSAQRAHTLPRPYSASGIPSGRRCLRKNTGGADLRTGAAAHRRGQRQSAAPSTGGRAVRRHREHGIRNRAAAAAAHRPKAHDGAGCGAAAKHGVKGACDEQMRDRDAEERTDHREERSAVNETAPRVIKIPAKPESVRQAELKRQLRVAAYCRVSTKEEDQANSYEVQKEYYTDKIMSNPAWTMAGVFADKGITGTSVKKREDFMRMIRHCRQRKIDIVLTKSVSRFARNTVDCLYYTRALKELGIAVIFEKENINSLEEDSELRITLSGAFAQSESESISANVTWGKRRAMESGKATIQYKYLYGYRRGADDKPEIIPEEAEVVRWIYERYLAGASTRMLRDELHEQGVIYSEKSPQWTLPHIKSILRNEKYCGDVLMQKTFQQDVINRKVIKNTGQLPMYLIENHHEGIVSREKYSAVQAEMARRKAAKSPSKRASTGLAAYTSRYALSDRLVCGECGTLYRRCTWTRPGGKRVVWRCVSRLDYGKKYCHSSPTLDEAPLQQAIIAALNTVLPDLDGRIRQITEALEAEVIPFPGGGMSLGDIDRRLAELEVQFQRLLEKAADDPIAYGDQFKEILDEQTALKELRTSILAESKEHTEADRRIRDAAGMLENAVPHIAEWDESAIRQLVAQVKVLSKNEICVTLKSGIEIRQSIAN